MRRFETVSGASVGGEPHGGRDLLAQTNAAVRLPRDMPPAPTFEIRVAAAFAASHSLRLPDGSLEPRHGHGWSVEVTLAADKLDAMDCVIDFHIVEKKLAAILGAWDRKHLNEVEPFVSGVNPSAERVAEAIAKGLEFDDGVRLVSVAVGEATGCVAVYRP